MIPFFIRAGPPYFYVCAGPPYFYVCADPPYLGKYTPNWLVLVNGQAVVDTDGKVVGKVDTGRQVGWWSSEEMEPPQPPLGSKQDKGGHR